MNEMIDNDKLDVDAKIDVEDNMEDNILAYKVEDIQRMLLA